MTQTRNHAHWSEGAWDSPIKSPQIPFEDLIVDNAIVTEADVKQTDEYKPDGDVSFIGGLLGDILGGIGAILSGAAGFVGGVFDSIVQGVSGLIGGIARAFSGGVNHDWEEDSDSVFAPIFRTAEEVITPILDEVEESANRIGEINEEIGNLADDIEAKIGEQGTIIRLISDVGDQVSDAVGEGGDVYRELNALNEIMQEEFGPDGAVAYQIGTLREEMDERIGENGEVGQRMNDLRKDLEEAQEEDYREINNRLWGEQGELNALNNEMWDDQSDLNQQLSDFQEVQLQFNDSQTGFNKKMQDFNELQQDFNEMTEDFMESQEEINRLNLDFQNYQDEVNERFEDSLINLQKAQRLQATKVPVMLTRFMNNGRNADVQISGNRINLLGRWTGHISYSYTNASTKRTSEEALHSHVVAFGEDATMSETVPTQSGQRYINTPGPVHTVHYVKAEGEQATKSYHDSRFSPASGSWTSRPNLTHEVKAASEHIIAGSVTWNATDRGTLYGIEVGLYNPRTQGYRPIRNIQSSSIGPTFPWGNPHATQNFITTAGISESELNDGASLRLRVYSNGNTATRREVFSASMTVTYIEET